MGDITKVVIVSCDKQIELQVRDLVTDIQNENGRLSIKTLANVHEIPKGADFGRKLEILLNTWSNAVIIICSDNLAAFIDKKDKSNCTDIAKNGKDCHKFLKNFLEKQMKAFPNKIVLVSVTGDCALPKVLNGVSVIKNEGDKPKFIKTIVAQVVGKSQ